MRYNAIQNHKNILATRLNSSYSIHLKNATVHFREQTKFHEYFLIVLLEIIIRFLEHPNRFADFFSLIFALLIVF